MKSGSLIGFLVIISIAVLLCGIHKIEEGYVGVYKRGGAMLPKDTMTKPGFHWSLPLLTSVDQVQVTVQTDAVSDIPCGTSGGVMISFDKIEVVNRLREDKVFDTIKEFGVLYDQTIIFQKIHHEINQLCSQHSLQEIYIDIFGTIDDLLAQILQKECDRYNTGIEILAVRTTKPRIPEKIMKNYESMEAERGRLLVAQQTQKVIEKEAETERKRATIEAQKDAEVSLINMERQVMEREAHSKMMEIEDRIHLAKQKALADAEFYGASRQAESNKLRLTPEYIVLETLKSISSNTKLYFGPDVPSMMLDTLSGMQGIQAGLAHFNSDSAAQQESSPQQAASKEPAPRVWTSTNRNAVDVGLTA